ncbi:predicted protein [Thalassiosira pseudonana CCMP1335]|uniref:Uncharacterized protein n=1 Tax=Thalassiosira pseudonana TaxID=35128 RepID=B8C8X5_THAPS|nr:predicted protein [Thalassiosira pseudonana CCMP1335]EED89752.1 predicted protein [Thalassiosira pseudonana CCMP1335]
MNWRKSVLEHARGRRMDHPQQQVVGSTTAAARAALDHQQRHVAVIDYGFHSMNRSNIDLLGDDDKMDIIDNVVSDDSSSESEEAFDQLRADFGREFGDDDGLNMDELWNPPDPPPTSPVKIRHHRDCVPPSPPPIRHHQLSSPSRIVPSSPETTFSNRSTAIISNVNKVHSSSVNQLLDRGNALVSPPSVSSGRPMDAETRLTSARTKVMMAWKDTKDTNAWDRGGGGSRVKVVTPTNQQQQQQEMQRRQRECFPSFDEGASTQPTLDLHLQRQNKHHIHDQKQIISVHGQSSIFSEDDSLFSYFPHLRVQQQVINDSLNNSQNTGISSVHNVSDESIREVNVSIDSKDIGRMTRGGSTNVVNGTRERSNFNTRENGSYTAPSFDEAASFTSSLTPDAKKIGGSNNGNGNRPPCPPRSRPIGRTSNAKSNSVQSRSVQHHQPQQHRLQEDYAHDKQDDGSSLMVKLVENAIQEATWSTRNNNTPSPPKKRNNITRQSLPPTHPDKPSAKNSNLHLSHSCTRGVPHHGMSPPRSDHSADAAAGVKHLLGSLSSSSNTPAIVSNCSSNTVLPSGGVDVNDTRSTQDSWEKDIIEGAAVVSDDECEDDGDRGDIRVAVAASVSSNNLESNLKRLALARSSSHHGDDKSVLSSQVSIQPSVESECVRQNEGFALLMEDAMMGMFISPEEHVSEEEPGIALFIGKGQTESSSPDDDAESSFDIPPPPPPLPPQPSVVIQKAQAPTPLTSRAQSRRKLRSRYLSKKMSSDKRHFPSLLSVDEEEEFSEPNWNANEFSLSASPKSSIALKIADRNKDLANFLASFRDFGCNLDGEGTSDEFSIENSQFGNSFFTMADSIVDNDGCVDEDDEGKHRGKQDAPSLPYNSTDLSAKDRSLIRREDTTPLRTNTSNSRAMASYDRRATGISVELSPSVSPPDDTAESIAVYSSGVLEDAPVHSDKVVVCTSAEEDLNDGKRRLVNTILDEDMLRSYHSDVPKSYLRQVLEGEDLVADQRRRVPKDPEPRDDKQARGDEGDMQQRVPAVEVTKMTERERRKGRTLHWHSNNGINNDEDHLPKQLPTKSKVGTIIAVHPTLISITASHSAIHEHFRGIEYGVSPLYNPELSVDAQLRFIEESSREYESDDDDSCGQVDDSVPAYEYDEFVKEFSSIMENESTAPQLHADDSDKELWFVEEELSKEESEFSPLIRYTTSLHEAPTVQQKEVAKIQSLSSIKQRRVLFENSTGTNHNRSQRADSVVAIIRTPADFKQTMPSRTHGSGLRRVNQTNLRPQRHLNSIVTTKPTVVNRQSMPPPHRNEHRRRVVAPSFSATGHRRHPHQLQTAEVPKSRLEEKLKGIGGGGRECGNSVATSELGSLLTRESGSSCIPKTIFHRTYPHNVSIISPNYAGGVSPNDGSARSTPSSMQNTYNAPVSNNTDAATPNDDKAGSLTVANDIASKVNLLLPDSPGSYLQGQPSASAIKKVNNKQSVERGHFKSAAVAIKQVDNEKRKAPAFGTNNATKKPMKPSSAEVVTTGVADDETIPGGVKEANVDERMVDQYLFSFGDEMLKLKQRVLGLTAVSKEQQPLRTMPSLKSREKNVGIRVKSTHQSARNVEVAHQVEHLKVASFWNQLELDNHDLSVASEAPPQKQEQTVTKKTVVSQPQKKATDNVSYHSSIDEAFEVAPRGSSYGVMTKNNRWVERDGFPEASFDTESFGAVHEVCESSSNAAFEIKPLAISTSPPNNDRIVAQLPTNRHTMQQHQASAARRLGTMGARVSSSSFLKRDHSNTVSNFSQRARSSVSSTSWNATVIGGRPPAAVADRSVVVKQHTQSDVIAGRRSDSSWIARQDSNGNIEFAQK